MVLGRRTKKESVTAVAKRIARLDSHEFTPWIEQCLYTTGRALTEYNRDLARKELLEEALNASQICTELLTELKRRDSEL